MMQVGLLSKGKNGAVVSSCPDILKLPYSFNPYEPLFKSTSFFHFVPLVSMVMCVIKGQARERTSFLPIYTKGRCTCREDEQGFMPYRSGVYEAPGSNKHALKEVQP